MLARRWYDFDVSSDALFMICMFVGSSYEILVTPVPPFKISVRSLEFTKRSVSSSHSMGKDNQKYVQIQNQFCLVIQQWLSTPMPVNRSLYTTKTILSNTLKLSSYSVPAATAYFLQTSSSNFLVSILKPSLWHQPHHPPGKSAMQLQPPIALLSH